MLWRKRPREPARGQQGASKGPARGQQQEASKRPALAGCSGEMLWRNALAGVLWPGALAGCSGGEASKRPAKASKRPTRGQRRPGRGPKWGRPHEIPKPMKNKHFHEENSASLLRNRFYRQIFVGKLEASKKPRPARGQEEDSKRPARSQQDAKRRPTRTQQQARKRPARGQLWRDALAGCSAGEASKRRGRGPK